MPDQPPGYQPPIPEPNWWKQRTGIPIHIALIIVAFVAVVGVEAFVAIRQHTGAASPLVANHIPEPAKMAPEIVIHESKGGSITTKGDTQGPSMKLLGDKVEASDLQLTVPLMSFDFGSIGGGSFAGSFKVSSGTASLLRWLFALLAIPCAVSGTFKYVGKDYIHAVGMWLTGLGLLLAAMIPALMGWIGFGAIVVLLVSHWFPSAAGATNKALSDYIAALWATDKTTAAAVAAQMEGKSAVVVAKAGG